MITNEERAREQAAVLSVVKGVYDAWNAADPDAFVADYPEDASAIMPGAAYRNSPSTAPVPVLS